MGEYNQDDHYPKRKIRPGRREASQQAKCSVFSDDFGDGFSRGKVKAKAKSTVYRGVQDINTSRAPPVTASSRRYKPGTALIISGSEDCNSADELNLCGSRSETQSRGRRPGTRTYQPLTNSLEQRQSASQKGRNVVQSPAQGARAIGKQRENRVAKIVPSPPKVKEGSPLNLDFNALVDRVPDLTVSSSGMSLRHSHSPSPDQRAVRVVTRPVASPLSTKVPIRQKPSLPNLRSPASPIDHLSFTELVRPKKLSTRKEESSHPHFTAPLKKDEDLTINRLHSEKRIKKPLPTSQKGKFITLSPSSTPFSSSTRDSGSSKASTRHTRKRFESDEESSSYQREGVPWADIMNIPSSPALATPKSGSSKGSQDSSRFLMQLTPPDVRMKKQATLDKLDRRMSSASGSGRGRSPKRKRSSTKEASDFSDECVIVSKSKKINLNRILQRLCRHNDDLHPDHSRE
jgi:hypothetical protein